MTPFRRILKYAAKYKKRFILGLFFSLSASIFNGISLTALKPIFEVLASSQGKPFQFPISEKDMKILIENKENSIIEALIKKTSDNKILIKHYNSAKNKLQKPATTNSFTSWVYLQYVYLKFWINNLVVSIKPINLLMYIGIGIIPIYFLRLISIMGTVYFITSTGLLAVRDIRKDLYLKMLRLPISHFVREKTGILMSRIINDATVVSNSISHDLRISINNFFIILTHVAILAIISYKLLALVFIGVPILLWPVNYFSKKIKNITTNEQTRLADLNGHLQEIITGIRVIRAFGMESFEEKQFTHINDNLYKETFSFRLNHVIGPAIVELVTSFVIVGLLVYGGFRILEGEFSMGSFFTFLFTLMILISPIKQMASWMNIVNRASSAGERIFEIIDIKEGIELAQNPISLEKLKDSIEFKNLSFKYPETDKYVLKKINIHAAIGKTIALVGHSGAGKSTLVDLIPRFYDPDEGGIFFDGHNIKDIKLENLRDKIGVVTQEIFLFNGTIRENIAFGKEDIPFEKIQEAAKMAFADEFIEKMVNGYDTFIGERGLMLSGGQRQRLSIARALLKDPEILILDEATSALDTESERLVQKALETLMKDRTTFVIAHRLSTIFNSDRILVLENGEIIEEGTHKELLEKRGKYKDLYSMQFDNK